MRQPTDPARVLALLHELGQAVRTPTTVYLVGGATAVLYGWRATTLDVDIHIEPESDDFLRALVALKQRLDINVELASPLDFIPPLPGWQDRSPFVAQEGALTVRHFDPYSQALSKLQRGFAQDQADVQAMLDAGLIDPRELMQLFQRVKGDLFRFPAIDPVRLEAAVAAILRPRPRVGLARSVDGQSAADVASEPTAEDFR